MEFETGSTIRHRSLRQTLRSMPAAMACQMFCRVLPVLRGEAADAEPLVAQRVKQLRVEVLE